MQEDVKEFLENFDIADNALQMRCLNRWNGRDLREKENLAEHTHLVCACSIKLYDFFIVKNEELKNKIDFEYMIRLAMLHDSLELLRGDILSVTKDKVNGLRKQIDDEEELFESHIIGKKDAITSEVVHLADLMACYKFIEYELRFPSGDFSTQVYKSTKRKFDEEYESFCKKYNIPIEKEEHNKNIFVKGYEDDAGIDICLSDSEGFYLSILIRGGYVVGKDNCKTYKHGPILLYDAVIPKKANVVNQPPILEPLATPYNEDVFYTVRYGVRNMTEINGVPVRQEDKELILRAYLGDVKDIPCTELPGKLSFVKL